MLILRQSTSIDIRMGPFVDVGDGVTTETGVTIGAADQAEVLKENGAATVSMAGAFAAVTGADGWYDYTVATGDVDLVGEIVFVMQEVAAYLPVFVRGFVVEEEVYDDMFNASAVGYLKPTTAGRDLDVETTGEAGVDLNNVLGTLDASEIGTNAIGASELATDAVNEIRDSIISDATTFAGANIDAAITSRLAPTTAGRTLDIATTGEASPDFNNILGTLDAADIGTDAITNTKIAADAIGAPELATTAVDEIVDGVFDEALSGHLTLGTFGQVMNALGARTGAVADASPTSVDFDVDGFTEASDDHFNDMVMVFTSGDNLGQARVITDYSGVSQNCSFAEIWSNFPADNDEFVILPPGMIGGESSLGQVLRLFILALNQTNGQIDSGTIAANAIGPSELASNAIGSDQLDTDAIGSDQIAANAIGSSEIASGAIDADAIAADAIGSSELANSAITSSVIAVNAIGAPQLDVSAVNEIRDSIINDATTFAGADIDAAITSRLAPTVAARTLDVAATGEAGVDLNNVLGTLDAAEIGTDAIGSSELATSAVEEIARAINPQQNSAFSDITFEMYDSTNHNPATGLTVTGERSLDGGAYAAVTGTIAEISDGTYQIDPSAADMNGALIVFRFSAAATDDTFVHVKTAA